MIYSSLLLRRRGKKRGEKMWVRWSLFCAPGGAINQGRFGVVVTTPEEEIDLKRLLRLNGVHLAINL